jgi:clan AA aspartic protease
MIKGVVHNNYPIISIEVGWQFEAQKFIALIDTGFTGDLKLSPKNAATLGLKVTHTEKVELGDQQNVTMQAALAVVSMEGIQKTVKVLIAPGASIIGVGLMKQFESVLNIDFKHDLLTLTSLS